MSDAPRVSIIIVAFRQPGLLRQCLQALAANLPPSIPTEVIVVLNGCTAEVKRVATAFIGIRLVHSSVNLGFAGGCHRGAAESRGEFLALLNDDTAIEPGWLEGLVEPIERDEGAGAVGSQILFPDGTLQEAGTIIWANGWLTPIGRGERPDAPEFSVLRRVDYCSACSLLVRRACWDAVGGLPNAYYPGYYEDTEFALALRRIGYHVLYSPASRVRHSASQSTEPHFRQVLMERHHRLFVERNAEQLADHLSHGSVSLSRAIRLGQGMPRRLLVIDDSLPAGPLGSGLPRMRLVLEGLTRRGYAPVVWPADRDFRRLAELGRVGIATAIEDLPEHLANPETHYDVVLVSRPHNYERFASLVATAMPQAAIVYDAEALFHRRMALQAAVEGSPDIAQAALAMEAREASIAASANSVVCVSEEEANFFRERGTVTVTVVEQPMPVPLTTNGRADRSGAVLVAGWRAGPTSPNADGLRWFVREVLPLVKREVPGFRLQVVGADAPREILNLASDSLMFMGPLDDLTALYNGCRIAIVPLRFGSGVKTKTIEALGAGVPTVSTSVGVQGVRLGPFTPVLVADDADGFASGIVRLLLDQAAWESCRRDAVALRAHWLAHPGVSMHDALDRAQLARGTKAPPTSVPPPPAPPAEPVHVPKAAESLAGSSLDIRVIAFYLPQFHPIPENDAWWGTGFTEWTNVTKATPQFDGHYQPRLPADLGFYDLRLPEIQRQQAALAKHYGIHGFCYHHYWFAGRKLLDRPLLAMLGDPTIDIPFCLCWANEHWTRRWDGLEQDVLVAQRHSADDDLAFIADIETALRDPRYIRIGGRPILLVYRVTDLPDPRATAERWRTHARRSGIGELFLVAVLSFDAGDAIDYGFDASVQFPPHQLPSQLRRPSIEPPQAFAGSIFDYDHLVSFYSDNPRVDEARLIRGVAPGWDNTARRGNHALTVVGSTPASYADWLGKACEAARRQPANQRLVFVNAWNEWGEAAYLEPDRLHGHAYLTATASVLRRHVTPGRLAALADQTQQGFTKCGDAAVVFHAYYDDLIDEALDAGLRDLSDCDVFVTVRPDADWKTVARLAEYVPNLRVEVAENRGRDIRPFLTTLPGLISLGYSCACKIHTKRSPHLHDGDTWRRRLWAPLIGDRRVVSTVRTAFAANPSLGLVFPELSRMTAAEAHADNRPWIDWLLGRLGLQPHGEYPFDFAAGTMFWFRPEALKALTSLDTSALPFEPETGQRDGTLAHAFERLFAFIVERAGYSVVSLADR